MSNDTASAVRAYAEAWEKGDAATLLYADDFTLHYFGRSPLAVDEFWADA